jgi:hypothetical protein
MVNSGQLSRAELMLCLMDALGIEPSTTQPAPASDWNSIIHCRHMIKQSDLILI